MQSTRFGISTNQARDHGLCWPVPLAWNLARNPSRKAQHTGPLTRIRPWLQTGTIERPPQQPLILTPQFSISVPMPRTEKVRDFMTRLPLTLALCLAVSVSCRFASAAGFPDKNLETAVRGALHLDDKVELSDDKLKDLFVLEAPKKQIKDLSGLEKCPNLALLNLAKNEITGIGPLENLINIQSLDLSGNAITDVGPLAKLVKLQYLNLANNQIEKIEPLAGLTAMSALDLGQNKVADITPVGGMKKLASLYLASNQVVNLGPLGETTRISTLELSDNPLTDLAPLGKQTDLNLFIMERTKVTDLGPLVAWAKADSEGSKRFAPFLRLYLKGNELTEQAKNEQLAALKAIGVRIDF